MNRPLSIGARGPDVRHWQAFLRERHLLPEVPDGIFGQDTREATRRFQRQHSLRADGIAGPLTLRAAEAAGYVHAARPPQQAREAFFPPPPSFSPLVSSAQRAALFGRFDFRPRPTASNPEAIELLDDWAQENLVTVHIPQLVGIPYGWSGASDGRVRFHRKAARQLQELWKAWEQEGLLSRVLTFDGAFAPRFIRGTSSALSSHAFASAFDINAAWNGLGRAPAPLGAKGSVLELVSLANAHGFAWGGHFSRRPDGMHFEVAWLR